MGKLPSTENARGQVAEERALEILIDKYESWPSWIKTCRRATKIEDSKGIDMIVFTNRGPIYIQIKSSKAAVVEARKNPKYKGMVIQAIVPGKSRLKIYQSLINKISERYNQTLSVERALKILLDKPYLLMSCQIKNVQDTLTEELYKRATFFEG